MVTAADFRKGTPLYNQLLATPAKQWPSLLDGIGREALIRAAANVVEGLAIPVWERYHPSDRTPQRALEAGRTHVARGDEDSRQHALVLSKACTKARKASLGYAHRTAEAARGVALAAASTTAKQLLDGLGEALGGVENELTYQLSITGTYGKEADTRESILDIIQATFARGAPSEDQQSNL